MDEQLADDPIRAGVEHWLHTAVGTVLAAPFVLAGTVERCVESQTTGVAARLRQPWEVLRSMFDLVAQPTTGPVDADLEPVVVPAAAPAAADAPAPDSLPIEEYESLAASQVVARLASLTPSELADVERFERAHRGRRTVLGKVDQLRAGAVIDPLVRRAAPADRAALRSLELEARATVADERGGVRWLEEHPAIDSGWADAIATRVVVVAELPEPSGPDDTGHVVGYLVLDLAGAVARVDQVFVTPGARELGFGDAMLAAAREEAISAGAVVLEGESLPGDRETKNLYERAGITARKIIVSQRLT